VGFLVGFFFRKKAHSATAGTYSRNEDRFELSQNRTEFCQGKINLSHLKLFKMSSKQTLGLTFLLRADRGNQKTGCTPLTCRLDIDGQKKDIPIGVNIHRDHWDRTANVLSKDCPTYQETQARIDTFVTHINAYFTVLTLDYDNVTPLMLKNRYQGKAVDYDPTVPETVGMTLLKIADTFVTEFEAKTKLTDPEEKRSPFTHTQWKATRNKLIEYLTYLKTNKVETINRKTQRTKEEWEKYVEEGKKYDIELSAVTPAFYTNFRSYLTLTRYTKLGGLAADKQIKNTKQLFTYAVDKEYLVRNPLRRFKCRTKPKKVVPLDYWEIETIVSKEGLDEIMTETQECYIAMLFSGFAYQDIRKLGPDNIVQDPISGELFLRDNRGKTKIEEMVPILPPLMKLILKYKNHPYCIEKGVLFPIKSNSGFNRYLKILMTLCGIKKVLKTHLARHTFAYLMISFNVQLIVLSKMLGHAFIRTTEKYFDVSMEIIARAVKGPANKMFDKMGRLKVMQRVISMYSAKTKAEFAKITEAA
jgi:site-specific recombinase XerD